MTLAPRKLASASCLSLACKAGEIARATPPSFPHKSPGREPGDCGTEGHPACHAAHPADAHEYRAMGHKPQPAGTPAEQV